MPLRRVVERQSEWALCAVWREPCPKGEFVKTRNGVVLLAAVVLGLALPDRAVAQSPFSHQIEVKLPKGANGMQPKLGLVYTPGSGNGIVGVGWQLKGLPVITRVNYGEGIKYAGTDTYTHSELGVLVKQADGSYRSKKESFVKFVPLGTCGDGPCTWMVYERSGNDLVYGALNNGSRLYRQGSGSIRTWALSSAVDSFGNSFECAYQNDAANGRLYPSVVTYTKGPGLFKYRTVEFAYEARTDVEANYTQSAFEQTAQRLKWISVKSDGALLRKYRLDYECGDTNSAGCPGTATGRSRLKAVTELGSDGVTALPPQTFEWLKGGNGYATGAFSAPPEPFTARSGAAPGGWDRGIRQADLNGDGLLDLIQGWWYQDDTVTPSRRKAWLSTGSGWELADPSNSPFTPPDNVHFSGRSPTYPGGWDSGVRLTDLNGDGLPDLIRGWANQVGGATYKDAWLNNGGKCATKSCAWTPAPQYAPPQVFTVRDSAKPYGYDYGLRLVDVNADGLPDLLWGVTYETTSSRGAWLNSGSGWTASYQYTPKADFAYRFSVLGTVSVWDGGLRVADVDGDGRPDMLRGAGGVRDAWLNTGDACGGVGCAWTQSPAHVPPQTFTDVASSGNAYKSWDRGVRLADVNADGKADILYGFYYYGTNYTGAWVASGSACTTSGCAWISSPTLAPPNVFSGKDGTDSAWDAGLRLADVNGDGRLDLLRGWYNYGSTYFGSWLNQPGGWVDAPAYRPTFCFVGRTTGAPSGWDYGSPAVDVDGDGRADMLRAFEGLPYETRTVSGPVPDLIFAVNNGLGGRIEVAYETAPRLRGVMDPDSESPGIPNGSPVPLVTGVTTSDGRGGAYRVEYTYGDARWLPGRIPEQRNLGFGWMKARDAQTGQYAITWFNQEPGLEGTVRENAAYTNLDQLVKRTISGFDLATPATGTELALEVSSATYTYERGVLAFAKTTTTAYDAYGNPTLRTHSASGLPTVVVTSTYDVDAANWLLQRLSRVTTVSGGKTYADVLNVWSGAAVIEKHEWLDTTNSWIVTALGYDTNGNLTSVTQPDAGDGQVRQTVSEFDSIFRAYKARAVNAIGQVTLWTYTADGQVATATDPNGQTSTTTYDVLGRVKAEYGPSGAYSEYSYANYGDPNSQHTTVTTKVDAARSLWRAEYFDGMGFKYGVTSSGECAQWVVVDHEKDAAGRPSRSSKPYCYGGTPTWTTRTYDLAGRVSSVVTPDGKATLYAYEAAYATTTDPIGGVTRKYTNAKGWLTAVVDAAGQTISYGYDAIGRLVTATLPNGRISTVTWDSLGRKTSVMPGITSYPVTETTHYAYDAAGNVRTVTQAGRSVTYTYDALNRVLQKTPQGETPVDYIYDETDVLNGVGRLTSLSDASGTTRYAYDPTGRVRAVARLADGKAFTHTYAFDLGGRLTGLTYPDSSVAAYSYTAGGSLSQVMLNGGVVAFWGNFDAGGKPGSVAYGNGVSTTYAYDVMGHVTSLETMRGVDEIQRLTYDWYSRPNTGGFNLGSITDNRINKQVDGVNTDETQSYTYDSLSRVTQAVGVWGTKTYSYDALGNLTTFGGAVNRTLYSSGQQLTSGTGLSGVTYDGAGNMLTKVLDGKSWGYAWTAEGRLASVTRDGLQTAQMLYDAEGQRAKKVYTPATSAAVTTTYVGKTYEVRAFSDGATERHTLHVFANDQLVASVTTEANVVTAMLDGRESREQWAMGSMYEVGNPLGAARAFGHAAKALAYHPVVARWTGPFAFLAMALVLLFAFVIGIRTGQFRRSTGLRMRLAAIATLLALTSAACSGGKPSGRTGLHGAAGNELISGNTTSGLPAGTIFYHRNHVNSSAVITRLDGTEAMRAVYLPFGEISQPNSTGQNVTTLKFTGQELDEETGLYYYNARYMDPALGRFISPDNIVPAWKDAQAHNRYLYVRNNPIIYTDPTGHSWLSSKLDQAGGWLEDKGTKFGTWLQKVDGKIQGVPVVGGILHVSFVWGVFLATGGLGLVAWGMADLNGMVRAVATAAVIAGTMALGAMTAGIANPLLYIGANFLIGFVSGATLALLNDASWKEALVAGLVAGAIMAVGAAVRAGVKGLSKPTAAQLTESPQVDGEWAGSGGDVAGSGGDAARACSTSATSAYTWATIAVGGGAAATVGVGWLVGAGFIVLGPVGAGLLVAAGISLAWAEFGMLMGSAAVASACGRRRRKRVAQRGPGGPALAFG